jgi:hypothetical protein
MRNEAGQNPPRMKAILCRLQRSAHFRRMVRVVVDQGDASHLSTHFEAAAHPLELPDRIDGRGNGYADADAGR